MPARVAVYVNPRALTTAVEKAAPKILKRQGADVRRTMQRSIKVRGGSSAGGLAPHTHNRLLKRSILFGRNGTRSVVIGPAHHLAGIIGHTHEFGGREIDNQLPRRSRVFKKNNNWVLEVGGHGPIREDSQKSFGYAYAKLRSPAQVARAERIGKKARKSQRANIGRLYPKRPFAKKALIRAANSGRLEKTMKNTIGPGAVGSFKGTLAFGFFAT